MYLMAIACLFGVPAYYLAKAKGRSGRGYAILTVLLGLPVLGLGPMGFIFSAAALGLLYLLPARPGAPGMDYLNIVFPCPECGKTITLPRHREGVAEVCPECDEIIRVPEGGRSPKFPVQERLKPSAKQGLVCFESFGRPEPAHLLSAILIDHGVHALVFGDSAGGFLPHLGNTQGFRVMIDVAHWDRALEIEGQVRQAETLSKSEDAEGSAAKESDA